MGLILSFLRKSVEYITESETGAVITGKTAYLSFISAVYDLASVKRVVPVDTIHTPDPHTAWALVTIEFKDASILPEDAKDHLVAVHGIRFGPNGTAVRIFKLGTSLERYKTTAKFFDFVKKRREEVANVDRCLVRTFEPRNQASIVRDTITSF